MSAENSSDLITDALKDFKRSIAKGNIPTSVTVGEYQEPRGSTVPNPNPDSKNYVITPVREGLISEALQDFVNQTQGS